MDPETKTFVFSTETLDLFRKVSEVKLLTARAQWEKTVSGAFDVLLSSILLFMYMSKGTDNKYL